MSEVQVLVEGDGCFTIIYSRSIKYDLKMPTLQCGLSVEYLWPEDGVHQKYYTGTIIAISS